MNKQTLFALVIAALLMGGVVLQVSALSAKRWPQNSRIYRKTAIPHE